MDYSLALLTISALCVMTAALGKLTRAWLQLSPSRSLQFASMSGVSPTVTLELGYALGLLFFAIMILFLVFAEPQVWAHSGAVKLGSFTMLVLYASINDGLRHTWSRLLLQAAMLLFLAAMVAAIAN